MYGRWTGALRMMTEMARGRHSQSGRRFVSAVVEVVTGRRTSGNMIEVVTRGTKLQQGLRRPAMSLGPR